MQFRLMSSEHFRSVRHFTDVVSGHSPAVWMVLHEERKRTGKRRIDNKTDRAMNECRCFISNSNRYRCRTPRMASQHPSGASGVGAAALDNLVTGPDINIKRHFFLRFTCCGLPVSGRMAPVQ